MKRKDALTDAVEALREQQGQKPREGPRQVVNEEGEVVTLGAKGRNKGPNSIKRKYPELSPGIKRAIEEGIAEGIKAGFGKFKDDMASAIKEALEETFDGNGKKKS